MKQPFLTAVLFFLMSSLALAQSTASDQTENIVTSNCSGAGCNTVAVTSRCTSKCTGSATVNGKTTTYTAPGGGTFTISVSPSGVVSSNGTVSNKP